MTFMISEATSAIPRRTHDAELTKTLRICDEWQFFPAS